jgi:meiotically up-regulated gene 157 (Mug157) protein
VALCDKDPALKLLIAGVINRQTKCIIKDPYANAFYKDETKISEWKDDQTRMQPGIHEHKWEIDSLCYPIRLAYGYYKQTKDTSPFDDSWREAMNNVVRTFKEQQRWKDKGPYSFMRSSPYATDSVPLGGYGYPAKPNGLICSMFRPSDDATIYPYLIPSNIFALSSLRSLKELCKATGFDALNAEIDILIKQVAEGLNLCAKIKLNDKQMLAYEVNGFGSYNLMDDANVPSLLSLKYLVGGTAHDVMDDTLYTNTRNHVLSSNNPFYFKGKAAEGVGGPHAGMDMIWPLGITIRGLTSNDDAEIKQCLAMLQKSHAGTGFMHESFHKDDFSKFSRPWFAWANTLFGEFVWKVYKERPKLLS